MLKNAEHCTALYSTSVVNDEKGDRIGNGAISDVNPGMYGDVTGDKEKNFCGVANRFFSGDCDKLDS